MKSILLSVALAFIAMGQDKPKDVNGWDKIRWGMTIAEARAAYGMPKSDKKEERIFPEQTIKVGDIGFGIEIAAKDGKVVKVELSDLTASSSDFDTIKTLLTQKYGHPVNEETKVDEYGAHVTAAVWTFPSTSIRLTIRQGRVIFLNYAATDKKALDVL